ncbi:hypothetical protein [Sporofaciens musculi]|uniref:hypothetical protein n=1 Tax=Sporofaciens musculi TaxID=2681861 RepID=UPI002570EB54|nr:hypothetical protein [Sporofaciens musculi]
MELRENILYLLEHYNQMRVEIDTLKFEMRNLNRMKDVEMIEALTFSSSLGEKVASSGASDKTAGIALSYQEQLERLRDEAKAAISTKLSALVLTIDRLDFYISKLPPVEGAVLREYYIENYSWRDLQELKGVTAKTLIRHRDEAVDRLVRMYSPLAEAGLLPDCNR